MRQSKNDADSIELIGSNNFLKNVLYNYLPFWPIFFISIVLSIAGAWIYIRYQPPIYEANASLILKDDKNNEANSVLDALNVFGSKKVVENEIEVMKSRTLMVQVVKDMGLYAQVYMKGKVRDVIAYTNSPISFIALYPDKIEKSSPAITFTYLASEK